MTQYAVALKEGQWTVFRNGEVLALGMSRSRAIERAAELAQDASEAGHDVELLVQDYVGEVVKRQGPW